MQSSVFQFSENSWVNQSTGQSIAKDKVQLVLSFAGKTPLKKSAIYASLRQEFPSADIVICSTAGEINQDKVLHNSLLAVALQFEKTPIRSTSVNIKDFANSFEAAIYMAQKLPLEDLAYMMVFSDGSLVNGSELVRGLNAVAGKNILVTGGLAGDDNNFQSTLIGLNEQPIEGKIVAIGFYGKNITVKHGSQGGWDIFGIEKEITRSSGNILYELENQNALDIYKKYLGSEADNLPSSALLFPLSIIKPGNVKPIVRTILSIDEKHKSMTFAGDVPEGSKVRFMKANIEKLIEAASNAAQQTILQPDKKPEFALLISCVGRKLVLGDRVAEEVEAVNNRFANETIIAGFYSYGEISPSDSGIKCQLHNQTMTITSFYES